MKHLDARTIRERLNAISLALSTLEQTATGPRHHAIAVVARNALSDISALVSKDESEEHRAGRICLRDSRREAERSG
ncbi:MAG: hypothetical protein ACRD04_13835 [Terriglobales bacterium]